MADAGLRTIALLEGAKGALIILAGFGLLGLIHHDAQRIAEEIVRHLHFNPASRMPRIFLEAAASVTDGRLLSLALAAFVYAVVRFAEAWGLWHRRIWAEWLGIVSGGMYLPLEIYELSRSVTAVKTGTFLVNFVVVAWLAVVRWRNGGR